MSVRWHGIGKVHIAAADSKPAGGYLPDEPVTERGKRRKAGKSIKPPTKKSK